MTRNQNHDATSRKRIEACDKSGVTAWSDLTHDVLFFVMMRLGVVDFVAFSGVCKSWRSLALSKRTRFMASRPPMTIWFLKDANKIESYLEDKEGRKFKTILPIFTSSPFCLGGLTCCGHLILFGWKTHEFWLVNPITRQQHHFPNFPIDCQKVINGLTAILVFSPSICKWVFVVLYYGLNHKIWFCIEGEGEWNDVSSTSTITCLHFFKGKIYTLIRGQLLYELRLNPEPKLTLLKINNLSTHRSGNACMSSGEHLYVMQKVSKDRFNVDELDFGEMKWVSHEDREDEYAYFYSQFNHSVAVKPESWAYPWEQDGRDVDYVKRSGKCGFLNGRMWYFPHQCLNVNLLDE